MSCRVFTAVSVLLSPLPQVPFAALKQSISSGLARRSNRPTL
jgi:hypothetical protein